MATLADYYARLALAEQPSISLSQTVPVTQTVPVPAQVAPQVAPQVAKPTASEDEFYAFTPGTLSQLASTTGVKTVPGQSKADICRRLAIEKGVANSGCKYASHLCHLSNSFNLYPTNVNGRWVDAYYLVLACKNGSCTAEERLFHEPIKIDAKKQKEGLDFLRRHGIVLREAEGLATHPSLRDLQATFEDVE